MRSALPATREAAGAPSAWSQPSQSTHERPRRWCDAGSPGRQSVTAAQKAGDAIATSVTVAGNPTKPDRPALSRIRPTDFNVSDGQAGSPPPQCPPNRFETLIAMIVGPASRRPIRALVDPRRSVRQSKAALVCDAIWSRVFPSNTSVIGISPRSESPKSGAPTLRTPDRPIRTWPNSAANNEPPNRSRARGKPPPIGVPGPHLCRNDLSAERPAQHKCRPGSPGERDAVCSPGYEGGRRRAIGVVAALSINPRATTPMVRRWVAGTPKRHGGPEGR